MKSPMSSEVNSDAPTSLSHLRRASGSTVKGSSLSSTNEKCNSSDAPPIIVVTKRMSFFKAHRLSYGTTLTDGIKLTPDTLKSDTYSGSESSSAQVPNVNISSAGSPSEICSSAEIWQLSQTEMVAVPRISTADISRATLEGEKTPRTSTGNRDGSHRNSVATTPPISFAERAYIGAKKISSNVAISITGLYSSSMKSPSPSDLSFFALTSNRQLSDFSSNRQMSDLIDKSISDESKQLSKHPKMKLLLLGPENSGKRTFMLQVQCLYGRALSLQKRLLHKTPLQAMLYQGVQILAIFYAKKTYSSSEFMFHEKIIHGWSLDDDFTEGLWESVSFIGSNIGEVFLQEYGSILFDDSIEYVLRHIERIGNVEYVPTMTGSPIDLFRYNACENKLYGSC